MSAREGGSDKMSADILLLSIFYLREEKKKIKECKSSFTNSFTQ